MDHSEFQKQILKNERFQSMMAGVQAGTSALQLVATAAMNRQLAEMRQQGANALALQQQMLEREELQSQIEEFVYSAQKILKSYSEPNCTIHVVARYAEIHGMLGKIEEWGLGTPLIKGRDNKAAFETMVGQAQASLVELEKHKDVQDAIAWAKAEELRVAKEQQKLTEQKAVRRDELQRRIGELTKQRRTLTADQWYTLNVTDRLDAILKDGAGKAGIFVKVVKLIIQLFLWAAGGYVWIPVAFLLSERRSIGFGSWYSETILTKLDAAIKPLFLFVSRIFWIPLYYATKSDTERQMNRTIDDQIGKLQQELAGLAS